MYTIMYTIHTIKTSIIIVFTLVMISQQYIFSDVLNEYIPSTWLFTIEYYSRSKLNYYLYFATGNCIISLLLYTSLSYYKPGFYFSYKILQCKYLELLYYYINHDSTSIQANGCILYKVHTSIQPYYYVHNIIQFNHRSTNLP